MLKLKRFLHITVSEICLEDEDLKHYVKKKRRREEETLPDRQCVELAAFTMDFWICFGRIVVVSALLQIVL